MTTRTVEERMKEHIKDCNDKNRRMYNFKIYKAMREIGIEHFNHEIIEECDNCQLGEREKFWIEKYNSVFEGYNTALGGAGKSLINDYQICAMKILYDEGWLLQDISKAINVNSSDIGEILAQKYNVDTILNSNLSFGKRVIGKKDNEEVSFNSISDAARFILDEHISRTSKLSCVISKISDVVDKQNRSAYGYHWISNN